MALGVRISTWRSTLGDTHPHKGLAVEADWWPMADLLPFEGGVLCAHGRGGGSQQALFRAELHPMLVRARVEWLSSVGSEPEAGPRLHALLASVQHQFDTLTAPEWKAQYQASCVGALYADGLCAVANTGTQFVGQWSHGALTVRSTPLAIVGDLEGKQLPYAMEWLATADGSWLGSEGNPAGHPRWVIAAFEPQAGDCVVLMTGLRDAGFDETSFAAVLQRVEGQHGPLSVDVKAAEHVGAALAQDVERDAGRKWALHSKAAIAVVAFGG